MIFVKTYAEYVYDLLKEETKGLDAIYKDFIIESVGLHGLVALETYKLVESCGVVNGRKLYVLCDKN